MQEGRELHLLQSTDIIRGTPKELDRRNERFGIPEALVNFNCILRTTELDEKDLLDEYGNLFSAIPTIGFSTYGEEYIKHVNQTATMLFFR